MRSSGLFFVAALILAGAVAGCSETKTPEAATEAGKSTTSPEQPGAGEVAVQPIGVGRRVAGNPAASNPGAGNPGAAVKVSASKPLSVHDLTKPELEAAIVKLSVYRGGDTSTAELGLAHFLQALRTRDVVAAEQLLTSVARVEAQLSQNSINLAEMSFTERTRFKIGKPEYVDETKTGARIPVITTTFDEDGEYTEEIIWVVGRDDHGWRVAGYGFELFEGERPRWLNFQDLEEFGQTTQRIDAEIRRRAEQQVLEARRQPNPGEKSSHQPPR